MTLIYQVPIVTSFIDVYQALVLIYVVLELSIHHTIYGGIHKQIFVIGHVVYNVLINCMHQVRQHNKFQVKVYVFLITIVELIHLFLIQIKINSIDIAIQTENECFFFFFFFRMHVIRERTAFLLSTEWEKNVVDCRFYFLI